ncbi:MAG TPA: extracellular solute-binding protein [Actinomycetota bacterium]|nr:extracellular solute-binding protein [Actinomycetota bacterium]
MEQSTSRARRAAVLSTVFVLLLAACSKSTNHSTGGSTPSGGTTASPTAVNGNGQPVNVLYAGSLAGLMTNQIGPAFQAATGYKFNGTGAGSTALASGIKSGVYQGDVFLSAAAAPNASLMGSANGNWVSWYATIATSGLVLGYNPSSTYASAITSRPWYNAVTLNGFKLGRTDPKTDPKGVLAAQAVTTTAAAGGLSPAVSNPTALKALVAATNTGNVFDETSLVAQLQTKQLDAAFFYTIEAQASGIKTVPLTGPASTLHATYTITILNKASDEAGAEAFVNFLLGKTGQAFMTTDQFQLVTPPSVTGTGEPAGLNTALGM